MYVIFKPIRHLKNNKNITEVCLNILHICTM